jgi:PTH1 family peptidyl-tRNA hydrolase
MYLIAGLGNPGEKYKLTRHNVGFMVIDEFCRINNLNLKYSNKFEGEFCDFVYKNQKIILFKPMTFMNLSGRAVIKIKKYYNIDNENVVIITDDVNLEFGVLRIKKQGGHGGHNGLKSVINCLNTKNFIRFRNGVGINPVNIPLENYVLSNFNKFELKKLNDIILHNINAFESLLYNDIEYVMNDFNKKIIKN